MTSLPAQLSALVADRYGLRGAAEPMIGGGDECALWRLASSPAAVVRVSPAWRSTEELAWTHRVANALAETVAEVTCPLVAVDGTTVFGWRGQPVTLWPFVPGTTLDRDDAHERSQAAGLLARLHRNGTGPLRPRPVRPAAASTAPSMLPDAALDAQVRDWRHVLRNRGQVSGLIHGDFYRRNILCRAGEIVGLIDWDDARYDLLVTEFSWALWELAKSPGGDTLLIDRGVEFALDYYAAGGPEHPTTALIPLIRHHLRMEIDDAQRRKYAGEPMDEEYQAAEIAAFHTLRTIHLPL